MTADAGPNPIGSPFGDDDPEDAWDAGDTPDQKLVVIARRLIFAGVALYLLRQAGHPASVDVRRRVISAVADLGETFNELGP